MRTLALAFLIACAAGSPAFGAGGADTSAAWRTRKPAATAKPAAAAPAKSTATATAAAAGKTAMAANTPAKSTATMGTTAPAEPVAKKPAKKKRRPAKPTTPPVQATVKSVDPAKQEWARAKSLAEQGKHDAALAVIREALHRHPDDTDLLWLEANVTGWAGRHGDAVKLFEDLMARHPELARDLRSDLAAERMWAGDPAGAVRDFDLRLEENPNDREARHLRALALSHADRLTESLAAYDALFQEDSSNVDIALERARVLGWMDRHDQAIAAYQAILAAHPNESRARLGLAQNENWRGHHRKAAALYEQLVSDGDSDPEVLKGSAYAYYWSGQPDRARARLDQFLARSPDDREGKNLATMLAREDSPSFTGGYERSDDSDALRVRTTTLDYRYPFGKRNALVLMWRRDDVQDQAGNRTPWRLGLQLEKSWSERWSGMAAGFYFKPGDDENGIGLGEASLTHRPTDRVRIDLGFSHDMVLTRRSLASDIRVNTVAAGIDWQARERLTFRLAERIGHYNDDNRLIRFSAGARGVAYTRRHGEAAVTFDLEHLQSRFDLDHGYYDPNRYLEFGPGLELEWRPTDRVTLGVAGKVGYQHENDADQDPFNAYRVHADFPLSQAFLFHVEGGRSDSNLSSASGFRQKRWAAHVTTGF